MEPHSMDMMVSAKLLVEEYASFTKLEAFWHGYTDYVAGRLCEPYDRNSIDAQAYDRGQEATARTERKVRQEGYRLNGERVQ
jgi:hypothetical protein